MARTTVLTAVPRGTQSPVDRRPRPAHRHVAAPDADLTVRLHARGPLVDRSRGVTLAPVHDDLWRVVRTTTGAIVGYVERLAASTPGGDERFRAKRMRPGAAGFLDVGEFWELRDAVDSLRFG